ncbi:MAG: hypothetical protein P8J01_06420 [Acidimicrobiales bacterium]|jgi:hypothetical protein|nr:hypothetical protein [Acidimicrobiales bacterium]
MPQPYSQARSKKVKWSRIIAPAMVAFGILLVLFALVLTNRGPEDIRVEGNPIIEALVPEADSEVLRQSTVGIDLISGYEAELTINGIPIPPDQINVLRDVENPRESATTGGSFGSTLNRFVFQPLNGRAVPELLGGQNCVVAEFWPLSNPSERKKIEWCFTAL